MFKLIGGIVVCGLALYGLVKFLERPLVKVVVSPQFRRPTGDSGAGEGSGDDAAAAQSTGEAAAPLADA
jgi:hypothetical protein